MEIVQFFLSGIVYMAEFKVNGKIDNGCVCEQAGKQYVNTGNTFYHNLEHHYFSEQQSKDFEKFVSEN